MSYTASMFFQDSELVASMQFAARQDARMERRPSPEYLAVALIYFEACYGKELGRDYFWRWLEVGKFLMECQVNLFMEGAVRMSATTPIPEEPFLELVLSMYQSPVAPGAAPTSPLQDVDVGLNYDRVVRAWRSRPQNAA